MYSCAVVTFKQMGYCVHYCCFLPSVNHLHLSKVKMPKIKVQAPHSPSLLCVDNVHACDHNASSSSHKETKRSLLIRCALPPSLTKMRTILFVLIAFKQQGAALPLPCPLIAQQLHYALMHHSNMPISQQTHRIQNSWVQHCLCHASLLSSSSYTEACHSAPLCRCLSTPCFEDELHVGVDLCAYKGA